MRCNPQQSPVFLACLAIRTPSWRATCMLVKHRQPLRHLKAVVLDFLWLMNHLFSKNIRWTTLLCWLLTPYTICCTVKVTIVRNVSSRICGTLCGPLEIPGGPPVVHRCHVENHCLKVSKTLPRLRCVCDLVHCLYVLMRSWMYLVTGWR